LYTAWCAGVARAEPEPVRRRRVRPDRARHRADPGTLRSRVRVRFPCV